jgi:hypothetical protein
VTVAASRIAEALELLQIEETDAWFEYLEATRGQSHRDDPRRRSSTRARGYAPSSARSS